MLVQSILISILSFLLSSQNSLLVAPRGKVLTDRWVERIENDFPPTGFHHICFTAPQELRKLLDEYRFLLNCLFRASSKTLLSWSKERHFLPAMVSSCHTSGRNLKFHPHIHMLMSSGGIDLKSKRLNQ